jgi:uncharacterized RDD family membrane protein YckC
MDFRMPSRRSNILLGERQTTIFQRFSSKAIDLVVIVAIYFLGKAVWPPIGSAAAAFFAAFQDSFGNGQSVGKRIMGLRVADDATGMNCSMWSSLLRNLPLTIAALFAGVPVFWAFALFVSVPVLVLESYLIFTVDCGVRLGDIMGNTLVVEYYEERYGTQR